MNVDQRKVLLHLKEYNNSIKDDRMHCQMPGEYCKTARCLVFKECARINRKELLKLVIKLLNPQLELFSQ